MLPGGISSFDYEFRMCAVRAPCFSPRKAKDVSAKSTEGPLLKQRLDSWKSIARHFGRSCRTVQRWHAEFGLPIRCLGGNKGAIFAYAEELDAWMMSRGQSIAGQSVEIPKGVLHTSQVREEPDRRNEILDASLISGPSRARAAELVVLAHKMWESLSHSNIRVIARLSREAIDLDPGNAVAFTGLSFALIAEGLWGLVRPPAAYSSANAALQRALEIDSEYPMAKCAAAWLDMVSTRDWQSARRGFDEALVHHPQSTQAIVGRAGLHIAAECLMEASGILLEAVQLSPLSSSAITFYCWNEYLAGKYANALNQIEQFRSSGRHGPVVDAVEALSYIQLEEPDSYIQHLETMAVDSRYLDVMRGALGYAYAVNGQEQRAREIHDAMTHPEAYEQHDPYAIALVLIGLNQRQEAVKRLEQSYREGSLWSLGFQSDPILASLHNDPHYRLFMSKVSYPAP